MKITEKLKQRAHDRVDELLAEYEKVSNEFAAAAKHPKSPDVMLRYEKKLCDIAKDLGLEDELCP